MLARIANMKVDPEELMKKANQSGLVRYLFGDDLKGKDDTSLYPLQRLSPPGSLTKQDFVRLQAALIR